MSPTLSDTLAVLRANKEMLRARGILHAAVFGSVARGEARPDSDVDVMIDLDPEKKISIYDFAGLNLMLNELLGMEVDLVQSKALKPLVRQEAMQERVDAF